MEQIVIAYKRIIEAARLLAAANERIRLILRHFPPSR